MCRRFFFSLSLCARGWGEGEQSELSEGFFLVWIRTVCIIQRTNNTGNSDHGANRLDHVIYSCLTNSSENRRV